MRYATMTAAVASAALIFAAGSAVAAKTYNSSHSNTAIASPADAAACSAAGGKVLQKGAQQRCSINYNSSKSNSGN